MRCLNEHIARQANQGDGCSGRFWEGRFKCQALLDEQALLTCMACVGLNPLRAGLADTPSLQALSASQQGIDNHAVPFALADYLELVDCVARLKQYAKNLGAAG